jgi:hypothetical protein
VINYSSPAQCVGYAAFLFGVSAFSQRQDRRLKVLNALECLAYAVHFTLLGNLPASASALVSSVRSFLALKTRAPWLAAVIIAVNLGLGFVFAHRAAGWLPVLASSLATVAVFLMRGVPMRLVLLVSTLLWLANNILSASIGGTLLESVIAVVSITTIWRMLRTPSAMSSAPDSGTI